MKFKSLLVLGGMLLASAVANAQWTKPVPATTAWVEGEAQYLYNVEAKGFFCGANDWGTRASVADNGWQVKFAVDEVNPEIYLFTDSVEAGGSKGKWLKVWLTQTDGICDGGAYTDYNNQPDYAWEAPIAVEGGYRISVKKDETFNAGLVGVDYDVLTNGFFGWNGNLDNGTNTRLWAFLADAPGNGIVWQFVTIEAYNEYLVKLDTYNAAVELGKVIDEAKAAGVDASAAEAVYNNTNASKEELDAAAAALKQAILDAAANSATVANPKDMSTLIENATFDVIGDFHGWSGTAFGAGGTKGPCAEHYQKGFDTWQEISGLPKGVYALTCDGFYRAGGHPESLAAFKNNDPQAKAVKLYAINATDTVQTSIMNNFQGIEPGDNSLGGDAVVDGDYTYYVPNSMASAVTFFEGGKYNGNKVMFGNNADAVKIGVKKTGNVNMDWAIFDTFRLTFYGNGADAYQMWNDDVLANTTEVGDFKYVTTSVIENYNAVKEEVKTAASYEDVMGNIAKLAAAEAAITENVAAWAKLVEAYNKAAKIAGDQNVGGDAVQDLADILGSDFDEFLELLPDNASGYPQLAAFDGVNDAFELTTEQVLALAAAIEEMREVAVQEGLAPGTDFTDQLKNVDFAQSGSGWTYSGGGHGGAGVAFNAGAHCAEGWNSANFDIHQDVQNAPVGVYEISVQGFYRRGRGDAAWNYYFDEIGERKENIPEVPAYVYLNDNKTPLSYVFDYQVPVADNYYTGDFYTDPNGEYTYPNNMADAGLAFDQGAYTMSAFGLVAKKGDALRIGVKGNTTQDNDSWAIFTRFRLTYQGYKAEIIKPELEKALAALAAPGLIGSDVMAEIAGVKAAAEAALADGDGKTMFNALADIFALNTKIEASVALFAQLQEKNDELNAAINTYFESPYADEASALYIEIGDAINAKTYTDAQAQEAIEKINAMITSLKLPANINEASDSNEVDMTAFIATPTFDDGNYNNSNAGWQGTAGSFGPDAQQKAALAYEYYEKDLDMYQDIAGLPNGTYHVVVNAFYRNGSTVQDFESSENPEGRAELYAKSGALESAVAVKSLASGASDTPLGYGTEATYEDTYYMPNNIEAAVGYFGEYRYVNELYADVVDGKLRIGMRLANHPASSWLIMDDWQLFYLGTDSEHKADGINFTEIAKAAKTEIFTLNGAKVNSFQKGVNIVRIQNADGSVKVAKIMIK